MNEHFQDLRSLYPVKNNRRSERKERMTSITGKKEETFGHLEKSLKLKVECTDIDEENT
jgi:hypothetical protein